MQCPRREGNVWDKNRLVLYPKGCQNNLGSASKNIWKINNFEKVKEKCKTIIKEKFSSELVNLKSSTIGKIVLSGYNILRDVGKRGDKNQSSL